ncbi:hypothetical protein [Desulfosediminicola flagellatus]|uniref:hypothetical protein n=1 Tax=Desulfosediminicola flagellatus TaxID=2569541 RepID=UPI0010AD8314|nr:hypothetical protein [Desulfosediminicola flagellatus]
MSLPYFLYKFAKVYVPGALALMFLYGFTHYAFQPVKPAVRPIIAPAPSTPQVTVPLHVSPSPPKVTTRSEPRVRTKPPEAVKPRYVYLVELASGGSMKAKGYEVKDRVVKIFIDDGYDVTLPKSDITAIKKIRL